MSAENLIKLAASKGYSIGRAKSGVYYYGAGANTQHFTGSWPAFVAFVKAL